MALVSKHVKEVNDRLSGTANGEGDGGTDETKAGPSAQITERTTEHEDPIQNAVHHQKYHIVIHGRPGQTLRLKIESHALIQPVGDRPDNIVFGINTGNRRHFLGKVEQQQHPIHVEAPHQTRQHGKAQPEARLLQPYSRHSRITAPHGLTDQCVQDLIECQRRYHKDVDAHITEDGGGQVRLGRVGGVVDVTDEGGIGRGHPHSAEEGYCQGEG
mmetsp:Transcript_17290/g.34674  ORF Transcript_17290/g.34674 Transcript_17290/m.34674 type:complete len:215 (+) Transcript_17290:1147-1791(+)